MKTVDLIRCTIELDSPLIIGTGKGDSLHDAVFVQDANGLPVIPGTTIAGVLRDRWQRSASPPISAGISDAFRVCVFRQPRARAAGTPPDFP